MAEAAEKQLMKERKLEMVAQANDGEGADRISNLPEPLAHHIMSFLPKIDVTRSSTLSKRFYSLWSSFPVIAFDENWFNDKSGMLQDQSERRNIFLDYVVCSIQLRQLQTNLAKFSLKCVLVKIESDSRIDRAINFALKNNVKDLNLNFLGYGIDNSIDNVIDNGETHGIDGETLYHLKETFSLNSVTFLKLKGLKLDLSWLVSTCPLIKGLTLCDCFVSEDIINPCEDNIKACRSLRLLSFMNVNITEDWVENYVPKFAVLEILQMSRCNALKNIRVSNDNLKEIKLSDNYILETIKIVAPELHSFQHFGLVRKPCTCTIDITACKLVKNISLKDVHITNEWLTAQVSSFPHLEILRLESCGKLVRIEIVSEVLRKLELIGCRNLLEVMVDTPNLLSFKYEGNVVLFGLMNSPRLRNPTLTLISYGRHTVAWFYGLRDLLTMFDHCEALTLLGSYVDFIFPEDVRDNTFPPLYDIKTLQIELWSLSNIPIDLVDNLLWISPHVETLRFVSKFVDKTIKFRYKRVKTKDLGTFCCKHLPIKCWRHHLKKIEMHNFEDIDDRDGLLEYFKTECQFAGNRSPEFEFLQTCSTRKFAPKFILP